MLFTHPSQSIREDSRGVSGAIGFMIVIGAVVIFLSINQAQIIPQENAEVEFKHSQEVQYELIGLHESIQTASEAGVSQYPTVELGTNYPTRMFGINPPPAVGVLQTGEQYDIIITNQTASLATGTTKNVSTRFLQYRPRYNEVDANPIWYEHSVLYVDAREEGGIAVLEDQRLFEDGTLTITALQNDFEDRSTGRITIELYPAQTAGALPTGNLTITLPTRLSGDEYWNTAVDASEVDVTVIDPSRNTYEGEEIYAVEFNINTSVSAREFQLDTVGIDSTPDQGLIQTGEGTQKQTPVLSDDGTVVYEGLEAVTGDKGQKTTLDPSGVQALGPPGRDLNGDGSPDQPFLADGDVRITDTDGDIQTLVGDTVAAERQPRTDKTLLATGEWDGSDPSVFYAGSQEEKIYRVDDSGSPVEIANPGDGTNAVMGTGDIDGDNKAELLFVDGSQSIRYIDDNNNNIKNLQNADPGSNNGIGAGQLPVINGETWAIFVDGSNNIKLVNDVSGGDEYTIKPGGGSTGAAKAPITPADVDGDGELEIVYVDASSSNIKYVDDLGDPLGTGTPSKEELNDQDGNSIKVSDELGVVSPNT